jgi:hypothetical protein
MNCRRVILGLTSSLLLVPPASLLAAELRTVPLVLDKGGTKEQPVIFDGQGMTIDLAIDVTEHGWTKADSLWTSNGPLLGRAPLEAGQLAGLFVDEVPIAIPRDVAAEKLHPDRKQHCYFEPARLLPGQMGYAEDGSIYFRWPEGKRPGLARVLLPPKAGTSCVTIACSHIIVRNITARHAANDGFNIHGRWTGIRLENVKAIANADEGISAHDDVEMEVVGAEIAWNGSAAGGVADVNRCVTSYRNCTIHDNLGAAFYFSGKSHTVTDTMIYNQAVDFRVLGETRLQRDRIQ